MYFQITTYCNMSCEHCSFSCEAGKAGDHMTWDTLKNTIRFAVDIGDTMWAIGGGEPTMHPQFWQFFGKMMEETQDCDINLWLATNGSITKRALALAHLANAESYDNCFNVTLSQDYYHDPIDEVVINTFKRLNLEIRDVTRSGQGVTNIGAAKENGIGETDHCACNDIHIDPLGNVRLCGCLEGPVVGNVNNDMDLKRFDKLREFVQNEHDECARELDLECVQLSNYET